MGDGRKGELILKGGGGGGNGRADARTNASIEEMKSNQKGALTKLLWPPAS